jgi:UDP-N-acetylmuramate dehydrogenase
MVSTKHANFIVNTSDDTSANDVEDLIAHVIATVHERFQVRLKPEVVIVGNR